MRVAARLCELDRGAFANSVASGDKDDAVPALRRGLEKRSAERFVANPRCGGMDGNSVSRAVFVISVELSGCVIGVEDVAEPAGVVGAVTFGVGLETGGASRTSFASGSAKGMKRLFSQGRRKRLPHIFLLCPRRTGGLLLPTSQPANTAGIRPNLLRIPPIP